MAVDTGIKTYQSPLKTIHNNMLLTKEGYVWAYYRVLPEETNFGNLDKIEEFKRKWTNVFRKTLPRFKEFEIFMFPKDKQLTSRFEDFQKDLAMESYALGTEYMNRTIHSLKENLGEITEPDFILGVRLKDVYSNANPVDTVKRVTADVTDKVLVWLGKRQVVDMEIFSKIKNLEEELFRSLRSRKAIRLTEDETVYVNRYNYIRHMEHDAAFEVRNKERITDAVIDPVSDVGFLHLEADIGKSVMATLPIANFESINISNNHLFQLAQKMGFPCEIRIKACYVEASGLTGFSSKVSAKKRRFTNEAQDTMQAGDPVTDKLKLGLQATDRLENEIDKNEPILKWMACFVIGGKDVRQCRVRGDSLISTMDNIGIRVVRPTAKQLELFYQELEGKSIENQRDYMQVSNGQTLAESLFAVTNNVGTNAGWYIGRTDYYDETDSLKESIKASRNIVLYNFLVANQGQERAMTDSPHIAITGETGKGKSYLTKMIFFYSSFMKVKTLYIDPKQEVRKQFQRTVNDPYMQQHYPSFLKHLRSFHYVTLDAKNPKNHGVLDPIVFLKDVDAKDTAQAMISSIYDLKDKEEVETA
ncbi:ATP-binding protein, partial [Enterococcus sp. LJL90]